MPVVFGHLHKTKADSVATVAPPSVLEILRSSGEPLGPSVRSWFEPRLGTDLGNVRIHHDTHRAAKSAREVQASAYAVGQHIVFGADEYAPDSPAGRKLLAHELAHVIQQQNAALPSGPVPINHPGDTYEIAAHKTAHALLARKTTPPGPAAAASSTTTPTVTTAATSGLPRLLRQSATSTSITSADAVALLTDAVVAMGRPDGTTVPPDRDHTRLRQGHIRDAIAARATNHELDQAFTSGVSEIVAASDADRPATVQRWARGIRFVLETQFVHEPTRSALDLLAPTSATYYRGFHWDPADYPGGPAGPNENVAQSMAQAMAAIIPERRPNIGPTNVMTPAELTANVTANIVAHLAEVPGQPHQRLLAPAARAFDNMQQVASIFDGVDLSINNSFRSFATARANAAAAANPMAVAAFSSHSLGLAVDFNLSAGSQHFAEVTTRPMQNVADMRASPTHKWMALHGEEFGWYPFGNEPWHWEYNPPGFRDVFRALVFPQVPSTPSTPAASGKTTVPEN